MQHESSFSYSALEWDKIIARLRDNTASELGARLVDGLQPLDSADTIERRLRINAECGQAVRLGIRYPISGCSDVAPLLKKLRVSGQSLTVQEIHTLVINLETAHDMRAALAPHEEDFPEICALSHRLKPHDKTVKAVRAKIDESGAVLDSASPALRKIRREIQRRQEQLRRRLDALMKTYARSGLLQEEHITLRAGRYVLPVRSECQRQVQGVTQDVSSTGATLFIEPLEIVERNNEISRIRADEEEEIRKILAEITAQLREKAGDIEHNQEILSLLDFHYACGRLSHRLGAQAPVITRKQNLVLRDARHPLLLLKSSQAEAVVPLTVTLGDAFNTLVISGPNAGGKTVALKTIGLLCLMAQCGLPVPAAEDSEFPVFTRILAAIGDPQSIEDDLSTFSAPLLTIRQILDRLSGGDLILLDELGTGTDPQEGVCLAIAVIEYLKNGGALTVVTTHHGGLKIFANEAENIENASLAFDEKSLKPTYVLTVGVPGSSYALELSRRMGLPREVVENTRSRLGEDRLKIEDFIRELELRISFYRKKGAEAAKNQEKLDELIAEYTGKLAAVKKEYYEKLDAKLSESEEQTAAFNRKLEQIVREIREKKASHESIVKAKEVVQKETARIRQKRSGYRSVRAKMEEKDAIPGEEIVVGGTVKLKGSNQTGTVIAENRKKKSMTVQMNSVRLEISRNRLVPAGQDQKQQVRISGSVPHILVKPEIDLRGMTAEDALEAVDQYLFEALANGLSEVRIIHGKGSGVLRRNVTEFLKRDDRVAEFRLGAWGEGDTGVSIARLKE